MGVGLDPTRAHSPGATAAHLLVQMGLCPPLERFHLGDEELSAWMRSLHGGWVTSGPFDGEAFPALDADVSNAFSAVASLIGWWPHMTAERLRLVDVTQSCQRFLDSPALVARMYDRATWRRWGITRVVLRARWEPLPVEIARPDGPRLYVEPTWAESLDATWLDAVTATLLAGRPVKVLRAVRLAPRGRQTGLRPVMVPGGILHPDRDPVLTLVRLRREAKAARDRRMAVLIRVVLNAMVYGNPARFDPDGTGGERPGPWCFPPLAATVAAGSRCLMAMAEVGFGA